MKRFSLCLAVAALTLAACGGGGSSSSDAADTSTAARTKNAALPTNPAASTTTLPATVLSTTPGGTMAPVPTTAKPMANTTAAPQFTTTTMKSTTLSVTPGVTMAPVPTTAKPMTNTTAAPQFTTTTLQAAAVLGARWKGQTFGADINLSGYKACASTDKAPQMFAQSTKAPAHVQWQNTLGTVNDLTLDKVQLQAAAGTSTTFAPVAHIRTEANAAQITGVAAGTKLKVRAVYYRDGANACVTGASPVVAVTVK